MKSAPDKQFRLKTENFLLRPLRTEDLTDRVVSWFSDPEVMKFVDLQMNMNRKQVSRFVSQFDNKTSFCFGIFDKRSDLCVGFFHIYGNLSSRNMRTAVVIGEKDYWGKGVVLETRARIIEFLFNTRWTVGGNSVTLHKVCGAVLGR